MKRETIVLAGSLLVLLLMLQIPFHHTQSGRAEKTFDEMERFEGAPIKRESVNFAEAVNDSIWVATFDYSFDSKPKKGIAIFVKHPLLPLYRMEDVHIARQAVQKDYITAVDDFFWMYLVQWDGEDVQITQEKNILKERIALNIVPFIIGAFVATWLSRKWKFGKK